MKVFVIHYTKLTERRAHIEGQLARYGFDVEFMTAHDKEDLGQSDLALFRDGVMSPAEMSVVRKHLACYERMCEDGLEHALILEDDATLEPDFERKLAGYVAQLPAAWDLCFIGSGCGLHVPPHIIEKSPPGTNLFRKSNYPSSWGGGGATRCADSYLVSGKAAFKILDYLDRDDYKISKEHDHLLNEIALFRLLIAYWAEPTLVRQESGAGKFESSLDGGVALRQRRALGAREREVFDDIKKRRVAKQEERRRRREASTAQDTPQPAARGASAHVDRPLAGIRPVAGRTAGRSVGGSAKGRFAKFGF